MVYKEKHIGTARTVRELLELLSDKTPQDATIEVVSSCHCTDAEIWYDEGTNTVLLK